MWSTTDVSSFDLVVGVDDVVFFHSFSRTLMRCFIYDSRDMGKDCFNDFYNVGW